MYASKHKGNKKNALYAKGRTKKTSSGKLTSALKPLRNIKVYVTHKPYQSITAATILSSLLLGWAYMKFRRYFH